MSKGEQDEQLEDAAVTPAFVRGSQKSFEEAERLVKRGAVPLGPIMCHQEPRQGDVLVLAQVGRRIVRREFSLPGPRGSGIEFPALNP